MTAIAPLSCMDFTFCIKEHCPLSTKAIQSFTCDGVFTLLQPNISSSAPNRLPFNPISPAILGPNAAIRSTSVSFVSFLWALKLIFIKKAHFFIQNELTIIVIVA
jgi:hypothetical protein